MQRLILGTKQLKVVVLKLTAASISHACAVKELIKIFG
jgi:hypothetical protein